MYFTLIAVYFHNVLPLFFSFFFVFVHIDSAVVGAIVVFKKQAQTAIKNCYIFTFYKEKKKKN